MTAPLPDFQNWSSLDADTQASLKASPPLVCPFCGQPPHIEEGEQYWFITCENRACHSEACVHGTTIEEAVRRWNPRANYESDMAQAITGPMKAAE